MRTSRRAVLACALLLAGCERKPAPAPPLPPALVKLAFGGDVMLSRHVGRIARAERDPAYPFRKIAPFFQSADIAFVNLESPFSDRGKKVEKGMIFKAEPEMIEGLVLAGIDVVSTANNHSRDQFGRGLEFTLKLLAERGIAAAGTGATAEAARSGAVIERKGTRFGFLAYTYDQSNGNHPKADDRVAMLDPAAMRNDVSRLRARADAVIVSMHAGAEYRSKAGEEQRSFARAAVDAGAAVVVGHHPHVIQEVEKYRDSVIFYSLGNLVFDQSHRQDTQVGLVAEVDFRNGKLEGWKTRRVRIQRTAPVLMEH